MRAKPEILVSLAFRAVQSPIGRITLVADSKSLLCVACGNDRVPFSFNAESSRLGEENSIIRKAEAQLKSYFRGRLKTFNLPLSAKGTGFQERVWRELLEIPYGEVVSYGELARRVGNPKASRAVASAVGRNPMPIVIPCQRVVGGTGELTGFASGLRIKRYLLQLEGFDVKSGITLERDRVLLGAEN